MTRVKEFPLPDLGEGLTEGEILKWLVAEGDMVTLNQPIVEVETAKAAVEIPAKWAGKVTRIFHGEGATIEVGTPIIAIDTDPTAGDLPEPSAESLAAVEIAPAEGAVEPGMIGGPAPGGRTAVLVGYGPKSRRGDPAPPGPGRAVAGRCRHCRRPRHGSDPGTGAEPAGAIGGTRRTLGQRRGEILAKPPVRKLARDLGVDLTALVGSGPAGSITRDDVLAAARAADRGPAPHRPRRRSGPTASSASRSRACAS